MIVSRDKVRAAYARALNLDPDGGHDAAVHATAQELGLAEAAVCDVIETADDEAAA